MINGRDINFATRDTEHALSAVLREECANYLEPVRSIKLDDKIKRAALLYKQTFVNDALRVRQREGKYYFRILVR